MSDYLKQTIGAAWRHRMEHGGHLHHRHCIHNLSPEDQAAMHGRTVEEYVALHGALPEQITPEQWECESPFSETHDSGFESHE